MGLSEENPGAVARHAQLANFATASTLALFLLAVVLYGTALERFAVRTPELAPSVPRARS